jgi:hypothetical protein
MEGIKDEGTVCCVPDILKKESILCFKKHKMKSVENSHTPADHT